MASNYYLAILKTISVIVLFSYEIKCCNIPAISSCSSNMLNDDASFKCEPVTFETCLSNAGYDQCTNLDPEITQRITALRQILSTPNCEAGGTPDFSCVNLLTNCASEMATAAVEHANSLINGSTADMLQRLEQLCQNTNDSSNQLIQQFEDCLAESGFNDCPADIKDSLNLQLSEAKEQIQAQEKATNDQICSQFAGECLSKTNECIETHLGADYLQNREMDKIYSLTYPACLELGTEAEFKAAADCLQSLPVKCGYQDFQAFFAGQMSDEPKMLFGGDVMYLRYACVKGCEEMDKIGQSTEQCFTSLGQDASLTADQIKALQGEAKQDFCEKVKTSSDCVAEKLAACPIFAFTIAIGIEQFEAGTPPTDDQESDMPDQFVALSTCDIDILEGTGLVAKPNGSPAFSNGILLAIVAALVSMFVI